jgi:hypothetical protein
MAKAKKRVAVSKKSSKRGKASAKPARKMAVKRATLKKMKSKVQRAGMSAKKSPAKKKRSPETVERRPVAETPVETTVKTTIIDVIEEPAPGVVAVTEYESVQTATSIPAGSEPERAEGIGLAGTSPMVPAQGERPERGAEEQRDALME